MFRLAALLILVLTPSGAGAQMQADCPPGPFMCVPWDPPPGADPRPAPPPPPPFFEVAPGYIKPEGFSGYLGRGLGTSLSITKEQIPGSIASELYKFKHIIESNKLYVVPTPDDPKSNYMIFKGDFLQ